MLAEAYVFSFGVDYTLHSSKHLRGLRNHWHQIGLSEVLSQCCVIGSNQWHNGTTARPQLPSPVEIPASPKGLLSSGPPCSAADIPSPWLATKSCSRLDAAQQYHISVAKSDMNFVIPATWPLIETNAEGTCPEEPALSSRVTILQSPLYFSPLQLINSVLGWETRTFTINKEKIMKELHGAEPKFQVCVSLIHPSGPYRAIQ